MTCGDSIAACSLQLDVLRTEVVEQPGARAEQHRHELDLDLVDEPDVQELLADARAHQQHVTFAGGRLSVLERARERAVDEPERAARHRQVVPRLVGEHEAGHRERDVAPGLQPEVERPTPDHHRPDGGRRLPCDLGVLPPLVALVEQPLVQPFPAPAHRMLGPHVRARHEAVQRHRGSQHHLAHHVPSRSTITSAHRADRHPSASSISGIRTPGARRTHRSGRPVRASPDGFGHWRGSQGGRYG